MHSNMVIRHIDVSQLATIVAGLVREGLTFEAIADLGGTWTIKLTGGF